MATLHVGAIRADPSAPKSASAAPAPQVTLDELALLYVTLCIPEHGLTGDPHSKDVDPKRAAFEAQLEIYRQNMIKAHLGASYERGNALTRLRRWLLREDPADPMIKQYYFSSKLPAGVVLFCDPSSRLFVTFPTDSRAPAWIADLLVRADVLYSEIREILRDPNRGLCLEMVFSRIVQLLKVMEHENERQLGSGEVSSGASTEESTHVAGPVGEHSANGLNHSTDSSVVAKYKPLRVPEAWHLPPWPDLQQIYEAQYAQGADLVRRMCQRQAQIDYFSGMVLGGLALAVIVSLVLFVPIFFGVTPIAQLLQMDPILAPLVWLTPVIGGIGAVVSVMQRMGSGNLVLRDRAGRSALEMMGAFRPLVGAVFASVVAALLATGLVPLKMEDWDPRMVLVYCVTAFFAGFSERFAQDMLGAGEMAVAGGTEAERRAAAT